MYNIAEQRNDYAANTYIYINDYVYVEMRGHDDIYMCILGICQKI